MVNGINTSIKSSTILNRDMLAKSSENNEVKEKEQVQLSRAEEIKKELKEGTYKIDLKQTSEKMASDLLNL